MLGPSFLYQGFSCSASQGIQPQGIQQHQNLKKTKGLRGRINHPHMIVYYSIAEVPKTGIQVTEPWTKSQE